MIRIATWNVEWATPRTAKGKRIAPIISDLDADVFVMTEGCRELLPGGFVVDGGTDWGYEDADKRRRKVLLWSKYPLLNIDLGENIGLPIGRFVSATVQHPDGDFVAMAVCIPWRDAHVNSGRKDRKIWEDHLTYLDGLKKLIDPDGKPLVVAGDFNQRIPRAKQPHLVSEKLSRCMEGLQVCTAVPLEKPLIDHIALSRHFAVSKVEVIPDHDAIGNLSDHQGACAQMMIDNLNIAR
jgi:endonuclease/exonuclease/phosphatase family metal-dependent hydrolase